MRLFFKAFAGWIALPCIGALLFAVAYHSEYGDNLSLDLYLLILAIIGSLPGCLLLWRIPIRSRGWLMTLGAASGLSFSPAVGVAIGYLEGGGEGVFFALGLLLAVPNAIGGAIAGLIFSRAEKESAPSTSDDCWWPSKRE